MELDWGNVPGWTSAGVTSIAAAVAAVTFWRNERVRRQAQARLVYATVDRLQRFRDEEMIPGAEDLLMQGYLTPTSGASGRDWPDGYIADGDWARAEVKVHNLSDELVSRWGVVLRDVQAGDVYGLADHVHGHAVPGGVTTRVYLFPLEEWVPGDAEVTLYFRDASGQWWERHETDPIRKARKRDIPTITRSAESRGFRLIPGGSGRLEPWEDRWWWDRPIRQYRWWTFRRRRAGLDKRGTNASVSSPENSERERGPLPVDEQSRGDNDSGV